MRRRYLSSLISVSVLALLASASVASAECLTFATDQTCENSNEIAEGIVDLGTLDLTNTVDGVIGLWSPSIISAVNATVVNYGLLAGNFDGLTVEDHLDLGNAGRLETTFGSSVIASTASVVNVGMIQGGDFGVNVIGLAEINNSGYLSGQSGAIQTGQLWLDNSGDIDSAADAAVTNAGVATITNSGRIVSNDGSGNGVGIRNSGNLTLTNSGTISGLGAAIESGGELTLTNSGDLEGQYNAILANNARITNSGRIVATESRVFGVDPTWGTAIVGKNVTLTNEAAGTISSQLAAVVAGSGDVTNAGLIEGAGTGIWATSVTVNNLTGGRIASGGSAIDAGFTIVNNAGAIEGDRIGIATSSGIIDNSGRIHGSEVGIGPTATVPDPNELWNTIPADAQSSLSITNSGEISAGGRAITAHNVSLTNEVGGSVFSIDTVISADSWAMVSNYGSIDGAADGLDAATVLLDNSGSIHTGRTAANASAMLTLTNTGTIRSDSGYAINGAMVIANNSGTIIAGEDGFSGGNVSLVNTGSVRARGTAASGDFLFVNNEAGGLIAGATAVLSYGTVFVVNEGRLSGAINGVEMGDAGLITNTATGVISAGDSGIFAGTLTSLRNDGRIHGARFGIDAEVADIENRASGRITSGGTAVFTLGGRIRNEGSISGGAIGVSMQGETNIRNSGRINGASVGVVAGQGTVANFGTITGRTGIRSMGETRIVNAGVIGGNGGFAINFQEENAEGLSQLRLLGAGRVDGIVKFANGQYRIDFAGEETSLRIRNLDRARATIVTGGRPYVVSDRAIQVYDPASAGAGALSSGLTDMTRQVGALLPSGAAMPAIPTGERVASAFDSLLGERDKAPANAGTALGYAATPSGLGGAMTDAHGNRLWSNAFGLYREQDTSRDAGLGGLTRGYGGVIGYEHRVAGDLLIGGFAGAGRFSTTLDRNSGSTATTSGFVGGYLSKTWGPWFADAASVAGLLTTDTTRRFVSGGISQKAFGNYDGWYWNPGVTVGYSWQLGERVKLVPALKARYLYASLEGYRETGSTANMRVNHRTLQAFEERAEMNLIGTSSFANGTLLKVTATAGLFATQRVEGSEITGSLIGQAVRFTNPDKATVTGIYGALAAEWQMTDKISLFGSGDLTIANDHSRTLGAKLGMQIRF